MMACTMSRGMILYLVWIAAPGAYAAPLGLHIASRRNAPVLLNRPVCSTTMINWRWQWLVSLLDGGGSTWRCALSSSCSAHAGAESDIQFFPRLNFERHDELTFGVVSGRGWRQMSCGHRNEMKSKVVLWKVTNMRDTTFRKHQFFFRPKSLLCSIFLNVLGLYQSTQNFLI